MILEDQRQFVGVPGISWTLTMAGGAGQRDMVLSQDAVMKDGEKGRRGRGPIGIKARPPEHDVVGLPLSGWAARVDQRRVLPIYGGCWPSG